VNLCFYLKLALSVGCADCSPACGGADLLEF
jgi:hypothetical protein